MKICLELPLHDTIKKGLNTERKLPLGGGEERVEYSKGQHYHWKSVTLGFLEHSAKKDDRTRNSLPLSVCRILILEEN